jgi:hypothetical protein
MPGSLQPKNIQFYQKPNDSFMMTLSPLKTSLPAVLIIMMLLTTGCGAEDDTSSTEELTEAATTLAPYEDQKAFLNTLRTLCGAEYTGEVTYTNDPESEFAGKELKMVIETCDTNEVRIPFHVGQNTSRTWVLTFNEEDGLLLKHDHRHPDGTPEEPTMYGGYATQDGTPYRQQFPADDETAAMLPEASTNVWTMEIDQEEMTFIYNLTRNDAPRFRAEFDMSENWDSSL